MAQPGHDTPHPNVVIRRGRGASQSYSLPEINHLFDIIERILPINGEEWEEVETEHRSRYPHRTLENLKRKFQETYRKGCKAKPTGDPRCPAHILRSLEIKQLITMKCNLDDGESSELEDVLQDAAAGDTARNISPHDFDEDAVEEPCNLLPPFPNVLNSANANGDAAAPDRNHVFHGNAVAPAVPAVRGTTNTTINPVRAQSNNNRAAVAAVAAPAIAEDTALKITLPSLGKRKKGDQVDPFIQLYQMKMLDAMEDRKEERKRREEERKDEANLRRDEMEIRRLEAQSFQTMMMALLMGKKPDVEK